MIEWVVKLSEPERWVYRILAGAILTAITGIFIAIINNKFAVSRDRKSKIRDAVFRYKSAFEPGIAAIDKREFGLDTFPCFFDNIETAVDNIRPILTKRQRRKLQKAWEYYSGKDNGVGFDAKQFIQAYGSTFISDDKECRKMFRDFKNRFDNLHSCLDNLS